MSSCGIDHDCPNGQHDRPGDRDRQQAAELRREVYRLSWPEADALITDALAAARADGDRLRERLGMLRDDWQERINDSTLSPVQSHIYHLALSELRAALDES